MSIACWSTLEIWSSRPIARAVTSAPVESRLGLFRSCAEVVALHDHDHEYGNHDRYGRRNSRRDRRCELDLPEFGRSALPVLTELLPACRWASPVTKPGPDCFTADRDVLASDNVS